MNTTGDLHVGMEAQVPEKQRHLLLEYAQQNRLFQGVFDVTRLYLGAVKPSAQRQTLPPAELF